MKSLMIGLLAWGMASAAQAQEWAITNIDDTGAHLVDLATVRVSGDTRSAWVLMVYAEPTETMGLPVDYMLMRTTFDCFNWRLKFVSMALFEMGSDEALDSFATEEDWSFARPYTTGELALKTVCDGDRSGVIAIPNLSAHDVAPMVRDVIVNPSTE